MRNQAARDAFDASAGDQDEEQDHKDKSEELSSPVTSRGKRKQERANKSRASEMTEEEMIDLALRLSEQEASIVAIRRQKEEEEAMMKAIQDSMHQQDQPCPPESQSLLDETDAPSILGSRRRLSYSNGRSTSAPGQGPSGGGGGAAEKNQKRGTKRNTDESTTSRKRKRKDGSPLLEMPDLSQTQNICSPTSPSSSHDLELQLDSLQSSDSTQIEERPHRKSPVFSSSYRKAAVLVPRLCQDLVQSCLSSGFVWSSQDSLPLRSLPAPCRSPTFPKSPERSSRQASRKSPVFWESSREDGGESAPENCRSPVFAGNSRPGSRPSPCRSRVHRCNSGFTLSSQESLAPVATTASCPGFPKSPAEIPATCESPGSSDSTQAEAELLRSRSPVFDGTEPLPQTRLEVQKRSIKEDVPAVLGRPAGLNQPSGSGHPGEKAEARSGDEEQPLSSNMTLLWSDDDEDLTQVDSPSPVFPEERPVHGAEDQASSLDRLPGGPPGPSAPRRRGEPISRRETVSRPPEGAGSSTVHYYWGVPFCPRGLAPDSYTQVILAQMEVYEKSLKRAQRRLLRKAEWGEAIVPQPEKSPRPTHPSPAGSPQEDFSRRRVFRLRSNQLRDAGDAPAAPQDEEGGGEEGEAGEEQREERCQGEGGQTDADDDCHVCPETQLSDADDDRTQDVIVVADAAAPQLPSKSPELLDVDMILQDDSPAVDEQLEEADMDALLESNSEGGVSDGGKGEEEAELDVETGPGETGDGAQRRSSSPELDPAREASVDCPICQRSFPLAEIEVHAAYCDGEETAADGRPRALCHRAPLKPRRKRTRKTGEEEEAAESSSTAREKCYVCRALVPLRDYGRHTELCIQQQDAKRENLLSALDKTESRDSGARPGGSKLQPGCVIDLLNDDDDVEEVHEEGGVRVSNSPIRSFTPISQATDCLIDFRKQQRSRKLSRRRR